MNCISALFMAGFLSFCLLCAGADLWQTGSDAIPRGAKGLVTGKWASRYEDVFNRHLPTYDASKSVWAVLNYVLFQEGNNGVLIGKGNWLFTTEEFARNPGFDRNFRDNIAFIRTVRDRLHESGANLVIVPVPAKARLYADKLGRYTYPAYQQKIYGRFASAMAKEEIGFVDTLLAFRKARADKALFLKTDTHWTPAGARLAARLTAAWVRKNGVLSGTTDYRTETEGTVSYGGDLLRYIPLGEMSRPLGLPMDNLPEIKTVQAEDTGHANLQQALFSDTAPPVTLVGTSYSANPNWNFAGFLKQYLHSDVLNAADEGLGPFRTMEAYLANDAFKTSPPALVIWEIPERYLSTAHDPGSNLQGRRV